MTDTSAVLTALHGELVGLGLVRRPSVDGTAPPAFIEPAGGPPAPGDREGTEAGDLVVVTLNGSELAEGPFDAYRRRSVVTLTYRTRRTAGLKAARVLDDAIRTAIVRRADYGLGIVLDRSSSTPVSVLQAGVYGGLGYVAEADGVRTDRSALVLEVLA